MAIALLVVALLAWLGVYDSIDAHRHGAMLQAETEVTSKAALVEEQLRRQFLAIDQTLRILRREWERDPARFDLAAWSRDVVALNDVTLQVFLTDNRGIIRASSRAELVGNDVSGRDYFRHEAQSPHGDDSMFVGSLRVGPTTHQWQLNLAHRLVAADGSFAGVIVASYDPDSIARLYGAPELGAHGLMAVVSIPDGTVEALAGPGQVDRAVSVRDSAMFAAMLAAPNGHWTGASALDDVERIHAFRAVPGRDLIVVVGLEKGEVLAKSIAWKRGALLLGSCITALLLLTAVLLVRRDRAARQREEQLARDRAVLGAANADLVITRAEAQAKAAQLEATLTGMSDGVMMLDANMRLLEWNSHFADFTGVPENILRVGLPMEEILRAQAYAGEFGDVDVEAEVARRMELLRANASSGRIERQRPGGRVMELRRNPIPGGGFVTLYTDVTARRLAEDRLKQAEKLAAIGRFTAGVAHDFNNLLSSIIGSTDLLHHRLIGQQEFTPYTTRILQTAQKGALLVRQLLASVRKQTLSPRPVDVNALVLGMIDVLRTTVGGRIQLDTCLSTDLWTALVDAPQFEHVILNLAVNARDAMPDGGTLTITTKNVSGQEAHASDGVEDRDYVAVGVTDTGIGMADEVQRRASEPFFTTKPVGRGSGLGLSQVQGFAQGSGGAVQIRSQLGKGTTVTILVPRADVPEATPAGTEVCGHAGATRTGAEPAVSAAPGQRCPKVLLVDDDAQFRDILSAMLQTAGYQPLSTESGRAAVRLIDEGLEYDLLLVDWGLTDVDGEAVAAAARQRRPDTPVVAMTARSPDAIQGEQWVLVKPFLIGALAETLGAALGRHNRA